MKFVLSVTFLCLLFNVTTAEAYDLYITDVEREYESVVIKPDSSSKEGHLGKLEGAPVMYEIEVTESYPLTLQLAQRHKGTPYALSLIVVRQNKGDGGVAEVGRLNSDTEDWTIRKDSGLGVSFFESELFEAELDPGLYRVEVSTPDNKAHYLLLFGDKDDRTGYFKGLSQAYKIQRFFDYSIVNMLKSSYVYYTLALILLIFVVNRILKYRKATTHVS